MTEHDPVHHPRHYTVAGPQFEAIKIIEDWGLCFSLGNAVKYLLRAKHKGNELQDLQKAKWYLQRASEIDEPRLRSSNLLVPSKVADAWRLPDDCRVVLAFLYSGYLGDALIALRETIRARERETASE